MLQKLSKNSKKRNYKSKLKVSSKPKKKRSTIDATNQELEEKKMKHVNKINKLRIRNAKTEVYEPYQKSTEMNLEEDKEKN
ncbi:5482_t:CDS:2 [Gigaspora margarita]|uniref:5482_t:CDS:1 n=1 Tax=Gigaspora margarita TaxID=4874 RepID=A0ABN7WAR1_GIGMA|nr:5482_t:CDS:2 [Gigaspora margarita]